MDRNEIPHDPSHLGVPSGVSKPISVPVVHSAQTMHLSWVKTSTIPKWTELSFHLSLVTKENYWVRPKWFLILWYVWCKPCTYVEPTLTLSPNGPKWDEIPQDPHHLETPSGASKMISEPIVHSVQSVHLSCIKISTISKQTETSFHWSLGT